MRAVMVVGLVLSMGVAFSIVGAVGEDIFGMSGPEDPGLADELERITDEAVEDEDNGDDEDTILEADVAGDGEPTTVGMAIAAAGFAANFVTTVVLLPAALINLGFPPWFAVPVGSVALIVTVMGVLQFLLNREFL